MKFFWTIAYKEDKELIFKKRYSKIREISFYN